jgi:FkbM family methyltransferase
MGKLSTYINYFSDSLKHGDFISILNSIAYAGLGKSFGKDRMITTGTGHFFTRGGTNDFQFANHAYEWSLKESIVDHASRGFEYFFDIGTCIGEHSFYAAQNGMNVYSFEAVPQNARVFNINRYLNNSMEKVTLFEHALGARNEVGQFRFDPVNTGASHRVYDEEAIPVNIKPFDDIFDSLHIPYSAKVLMKIDVEGMEPQVLEGAMNTLRNLQTVSLIMEDKFDENDYIINTLNRTGSYSFSRIDAYNALAEKQ